MKKTLHATWASHSLAERALAYHRVRMIGSVALSFLFLTIGFLAPAPGVTRALSITIIDILILIWQRSMALKGKPRLSTWVSLLAATSISTMGLHLGGGFMTLGFGIYLVLILTTALVFQSRKAAIAMAGITSSLYLYLAVIELTKLLTPNNSTFVDVYDFSQQSRLIFANILYGLILILLTTLASGSAAEILAKWATNLTQEVKMKTAQLRDALNNMEITYNNIVNTLANVIEVRDHYTSHHSNRIADLAVRTARILGYEEKSLEQVKLAAMLHDIGKIGVPDHILNKPGPLDETELSIFRKHPEIGANIVSTINELSDIADVIHAHQERYDGAGYPKGLRGEEIPLTARLIAVVDAYVAITDERPYKPARSDLEAQKELIVNAGSQFDPKIVDAFLYALQLARRDSTTQKDLPHPSPLQETGNDREQEKTH